MNVAPITALRPDAPDQPGVLQPIASLLRDPSLTEIMINGPDAIYVERDGHILFTDRRFDDENQLLGAIDALMSGLGRPLDMSDPVIEARLLDGSRLTVVLPPVAVDGPMVTIRRFSPRPIGIEEQIRFGSLSVEAACFLQACVLARANVLISGGSSSGKTTLLNGLSAYIPENERIVTIEEAAELRLQQDHVCRLESFPAGEKGKTLRELVRHAVRMRPDRLIVGEVRGGEGLDMLQAMNTGHDGAMSTIHANGPRDALSRLETLVLMAGIDLPVRAIRQQIQAAINVLIHVSRQADGSRKVVSVAELVGLEDQAITLQEIFVSEVARMGAGARGWTRLVPTGIRPHIMDKIYQRGLAGPELGRIFPPQNAGVMPTSGRRPIAAGEAPGIAPDHDRRQR
jgi:pilus assembly protein CpaF